MTTKTTKTTTHAKIGTTLIGGLLKRPAPSSERYWVDTICPQFHLRQMTTGRLTFNVRFSRTKVSTIGTVQSWKTPELARDYALTMLTEYRTKKGIVKVERPDAPIVASLSVAQVFGLRARFASDGVEVPGLYRERSRRGRKRCHTEYLFDRFVLFAGPSTPFATLTDDVVLAWVEREARTISTKTGERVEDESVRRCLAELRTAFKWATTKKVGGVPLILTNPAKDVKVERTGKRVDRNKKPRFLTDDEETRLFAALAARDLSLRAKIESGKAFGPGFRRDGCVYADCLTPLVTLALETGGRRGGLFNLRWKDVENLPIHRLHFDGAFQKAGQTYYVPLSLRARRALAAWKPKTAAPSDLIFPGVKDNVQESTPRPWYDVLKVAEIVGFRFHDNRHTFASKLAQRGEVSLKQISLWMGHSSIRMTEKYAHLLPDAHANAIEGLSRPLVKVAQPEDAIV